MLTKTLTCFKRRILELEQNYEDNKLHIHQHVSLMDKATNEE